MKNDLSGQVNIGKELQKQLNQAGIDSIEKLITAGSENAFLKIQAFDPGACLNMLYALEGAIEGIRWHHLPKERMRDLKMFFDSSKKEL